MIRRTLLLWGTLGLTGVVFALAQLARIFQPRGETMADNAETFALDFQWQTFEPFIFCVHHLDYYPEGDSDFAPTQGLDGRSLGNDFTPLNGFRMYHGRSVPGFPVHPHRGFETITIVRKGYVDHADSIGAAGRYGQGDVQWMTAGAGVQHSEMFPLLKQDEVNTLELFQIWLNLPSKSKMVQPHFKMFWSEKIPVIDPSPGVQITLIAGQWAKQIALTPPPDSWASQTESDLNIWLIKLAAHAELRLPKGQADSRRTLYFFDGETLEITGFQLSAKTGWVGSAEEQVLKNGSQPSEILVLQARPIGEPIVQYGPFVMNTEAEIRQTIRDYQSTQFGGWPWPREDMVHGAPIKRFAKYPDGRIETPTETV